AIITPFDTTAYGPGVINFYSGRSYGYYIAEEPGKGAALNDNREPTLPHKWTSYLNRHDDRSATFVQLLAAGAFRNAGCPSPGCSRDTLKAHFKAYVDTVINSSIASTHPTIVSFAFYPFQTFVDNWPSQPT